MFNQKLITLCAFLFALNVFGAEDDYEFMPADAWRGHAETGDDDHSYRLHEGFIGLHDLPTKKTLLEPVDGFGGFDNVAPQLQVEEGPGGLEWDPSPTYRTRYKNQTDYTVSSTHNMGNNWFTKRPYATYDSTSDEYRVRFDANTFRVYENDSANVYVGRWGNRNSALKVVGGHLWLYDTGGKIYFFPSTSAFRCESITGPNGNKIKFIESGGQLERVDQVDASSTTVRKWHYSISSNRITLIEVEGYDGSDYNKYREIEFTYHDTISSPEDSSSGDLIRITDKKKLSSSGTKTEMGETVPDLDTWLQRSWVFKYYTGTYNASTNPGNPYQVKAVIGPESYRQYVLTETPSGDEIFETAASGLSSYLDKEYEYGSDRKLSELTIETGCGCGGGEGIYDYTWEEKSPTPSNLGGWASSVDIDYPDGSTRTYDYNLYGQTYNEVITDGSDTWMRRWSYSTSYGYLNYRYPYATCNSYNSTTHTIDINTHLSSAGGRFKYSYDSTYRNLTEVKRKKVGGTDVLINKKTFVKYPTSGSDSRVRFLKSVDSSYPTEGSEKQTTFSYTFHGSDELWVKLRTTTLPAVPTSENGSGSSIVSKDYFDADGYLNWSLDGEDYIHFQEFDEDTWLMTKRVVDVDTTKTGYTSPPTGIGSTKAGAGLHLITEYEYDDLSRMTRRILPGFDALAESGGDSMSNDLKMNNRWFYTTMADEEFVTLFYPNVSGSTYYDAAVTIMVMDADDHTIIEALGELTSSYKDTDLSDDFVETDSSLSTAFEGEIIQRTDHEYSGGSLEKTHVWIDADGLDNASNKHTTEYTYNEQGQKETVKNAVDTITKWEYDALGRIIKTSVGTTTSNLKLVEERVYDENSGGTRSQKNVGHLTTLKQYPAHATGGSCSLTTDTRTTEYDYDMRGRASEIREPEDVKKTFTYSNLDLVKVTEVYDTSSGSTLVDKRENIYDIFGRVYESRRYEVPDVDSDGNGEYLGTYTWRDGRGLVIKNRLGGDIFKKTAYDGAGRSEWEAISYDTDESDTSYSAADDLSGDTVIEEKQTEYDGLGSSILVATYKRKSGGTGEGSLTVGGSGNSDPQYETSWFDELHREIRYVNKGDNGDTDLTTRPTGPPSGSSSSTELVSKTSYTLKGEAKDTTSPEGQVDKFVYLDWGPLEKKTENWVTPGTFSSSNPDQNRITDYEYNGIGKQTKVTAQNRVKVSGAYKKQETIFVYGVTCGTTSESSKVNSNDFLQKIQHPNPSTGIASNDSANTEEFAYNALGELTFKKERGATEHEFTYNDRGNLTKDEATAWETNVDNNVERIETAYDALDRPTSVSTYSKDWDDRDSDANTTEVLLYNKVEITYGPYDTVTTLSQDNDGVGSGASKDTDYDYDLPESGDDGVRLTDTTYPDGTTVISREYDTGADDTLNRSSGLKKSTAWIVQDDHNGYSQLEEREFEVTSTTVKWNLTRDRFDRPYELSVTSGSSYLNRYFYTYNYDSQVTFKENRSTDCSSNADYSEEFTYNGLRSLTKMEKGNATTGATTLSTTYDIECLTRNAAQNVTGRFLGTAYYGQCSTETTYEFNTSEEITQKGSDYSYASYLDQGDMTDKGNIDYTYDAWHRLVKVVDNSDTMNPITVAEYEWNGLGQRITDDGGKDFYYGSSGELLFEDSSGTDYWHVWGTNGKNDYVGYGSGTTVDFYHAQDSEKSTITQIYPSSGSVYYRYTYDGYGSPTAVASDWCSTTTIGQELCLYKGKIYGYELESYYVGDEVFIADLGFYITYVDGGGSFLTESDESACCVSPEVSFRDKGNVTGGGTVGDIAKSRYLPRIENSKKLGFVSGRLITEKSCAYTGDCNKCEIDQRYKILEANRSFLSSARKGKQNADRKKVPPFAVGQIVEDNPAPKGCKAGRLITIDAPGGFGVLAKGKLRFKTTFKSNPKRSCRYRKCVVFWDYTYTGSFFEKAKTGRAKTNISSKLVSKYCVY